MSKKNKRLTMVFVINKKTEARDCGEISFETVGVWPNFDKAMEHLKDIKEKVGESGTIGISKPALRFSARYDMY